MASQIGIETEDATTEVGHRNASVPVASNSGEISGGATATACDSISSLIRWIRPFWTSAVFATINYAYWLVALSSLRVYCLCSLTLALIVLALTAKDIALSNSKGVELWRTVSGSWEAMASGHHSKSGRDSWMSLQLFLQETSSFKQQNPGKFCLLVCSLCTFLAVIGRYIPGIIISYIIVLAVFLGPVMSWQDVTRWLEPVLQKLDFGLVHFLHRVKEDHERRLLQTQTEQENIEDDLSSMFPKLDSMVCKEMCISDTEASEGTWTDNGTFNLSEGHTPQTENSEDLDREEVFSGGLLEFPSVDNGIATNGDDDSELSVGLPSPLVPAQPQPDREQVEQALDIVNRMAGDAIAAAVTAAIQEKLEGAWTQSQTPELSLDSDSEVEDFELLDQSELETLEGELGLRPNKSQAQGEAAGKPSKASTGFFSKLLGRH